MTYFKRDRFSGIVPALSPRLINPQFAQIAENIDFESGRLAPIYDNSLVFTLASGLRNSIYLYSDDKWLEWDEDGVRAVPGPIPGDVQERLYWSGQDYPRMGTYANIVAGSSGYPANSYRLGVPAPDAAPTTSKSGTPDEDQTPDDVSYVYTFVTAFGEEGPPSPASAAFERTDTEQVALTLPSHPGGNYNFGTGALKRIYRSNSGSTSSAFQFVAEISYNSSSYTDTTPSAGLGEVLPSLTWIGPPDDDSSLYPDGPLQNLIAVANGIFAGFTGKRLCFSQPYVPHAWPIDYRITIEEPIVAIAAVSNGVIVLTKGVPYFVTGTDASAMTPIRVDLAQSCINKDSVVDMGDYVLYAGPDGLCSVASAQGSVITEGVISAKQWNSDFSPSTYRAFRHENTYVAFWSEGGEHKGFVYDPRGGETALSMLTTPSEIRGGYMVPQTGELHLIVANTILKYRGGTNPQTLIWKSKEFTTDQAISMSWVSVVAQDYPVTVKVWADKEVLAEYTLSKSGSTYTQTVVQPAASAGATATLAEPIMRLPAKMGKVWEIEVTGTTVIDEVCIAQTTDEIKTS
jgi:hypothetical protein